MTITAEPPTTTTSEPAPASVKKGSGEVGAVKRRMPRAWAAATVVVILASVLAGVFVYAGAGKTQQVLVASDTIVRGSVLGEDSFSSIAVAADQTTAGLPASQIDQLTGKIAAVDIPKGGLITAGSVTEALTVPEGRALVGLTLKPGQLPAQRLTAGDTVYLVTIPPQGVAPTAEVSNAATIPATVSQVTPIANTNDVVVDVYVSDTSAPQVTAQAAAGTLAIYLVSGNSQ